MYLIPGTKLCRLSNGGSISVLEMMDVSPVYWFSVEDFSSVMAVHTRMPAPGGTAARPQPALVCVVFAERSVDLVVTVFLLSGCFVLHMSF